MIITMRGTFLVTTGISVTSAFYVIFYVQERAHLQIVSGVKIPVLWLTAYVCDLLHFLAIIALCVILIVCFQIKGYRTSTEIGTMFLLLFVYGLGALPVRYLLSCLISKSSSAISILITFGILFPFGCLIGMIYENNKTVKTALFWIQIFPTAALFMGLSHHQRLNLLLNFCNDLTENCAATNELSREECRQNICTAIKVCCELRNHFDWEPPGMGSSLVFLLACAVVSFLIIVLIESKLLFKLLMFLYATPKDDENEDVEVYMEKQRIRHMDLNVLKRENVVVIRNLTKCYDELVAVNNLCLGLKDGECFGLLGINGAGKTTTFKMLTGQTVSSSGDAWVKGHSIKWRLSRVNKYVGYCPQFDGLLDHLTARETLVIFSLIRGIPSREIANYTERLSVDFDFHEHLNKTVVKLSGGNKRKLSAAVALIGDPAVVYMDEPTAGMDVATRRYLWDVLMKIRASGRCIVLTSHSMEECEALCTRLVIMVNGAFQCLGSVQYLKSKFAEGIIVVVKIKKQKNATTKSYEEIEINVRNALKKHFKVVNLKDMHQRLIEYNIIDKMAWADVFSILLQIKTNVAVIEDFSAGQVSLEQIFPGFAKHQKESEETA